MKRRAPPQPIQNLLDKAIAYVAPRIAGRRMQARTMLALAGGYTGARMDRAALAAFRPTGGSPDTDVIFDLPVLRARARDLERNAPVAAGVVNTTTSHVVGTGLSCNPQLDAEFLGLSEDEATAWQLDTRRRFKAWAETPDCDLARFLNFYGLQDLAVRSTLSSGDIFVVTPRVARAGKPAKLALQLIEADRVSNPQRTMDTDVLTDGIEHSPDTGEAIAYHFSSRHPGDLIRKGAMTWTRVAARGDSTGRRSVLHLFKVLRPGLRRGVPILAPVIEPLKQLTRYTDAELAAAVTAGLFSVFFKMDPQAFQDVFDDDAQRSFVDRASKWSGELEAGKAINLLPGEEPITVNPGRPNEQFDPFVQSCMRQIGMAIGIPYEVLVMHYQSSYSAARGALLMAWKFFMGWRDWLSTSMCQPVYELWLADEVAGGRIPAPGFFADDVVRHAWCSAQWVGDGPGSIDPTKEVDAAQKRVALGISTLQAESILYDGVDWETKHRQAIKEAAAREAAGMPPPGQDPMPPAAGDPSSGGDGGSSPPPSDPPKPSEDAAAMREATAAMLEVAARPAPTLPAQTFHITTPPVTVHQGDVQVDAPVHVPATTVVVQAAQHHIDANIQSVNDVTVNGTGAPGDTWGP